MSRRRTGQEVEAEELEPGNLEHELVDGDLMDGDLADDDLVDGGLAHDGLAAEDQERDGQGEHDREEDGGAIRWPWPIRWDEYYIPAAKLGGHRVHGIHPAEYATVENASPPPRISRKRALEVFRLLGFPPAAREIGYAMACLHVTKRDLAEHLGWDKRRAVAAYQVYYRHRRMLSGAMRMPDLSNLDVDVILRRDPSGSAQLMRSYAGGQHWDLIDR